MTKTTFRRRPVFEIKMISAYLGGLYEVRRDGLLVLRACLETCEAYVEKWGAA